MQGAIAAQGKQAITKLNPLLNPNTYPISQMLKFLL
jgi:hypothetical protein